MIVILCIANAPFALIYANEVHEYINRWLMNIWRAANGNANVVATDPISKLGSERRVWRRVRRRRRWRWRWRVETHMVKYYQSEFS